MGGLAVVKPVQSPNSKRTRVVCVPVFQTLHQPSFADEVFVKSQVIFFVQSQIQGLVEDKAQTVVLGYLWLQQTGLPGAEIGRASCRERV